MAINFPSSPSINDEFIVAGKAWSWTGSVWKKGRYAIFDDGFSSGDLTITSVQDGEFLRYNGSASAWINDPVNLSTDTVGDYVESLVAGTGVTLTNNFGEGTTPTIAIGQAVGASSSVTFALVTAPLLGNSSTATTLQTSRNIAGQSFNGSADISIAPTDLTGVTSTAAELNILDGATLSTTELNYVDGVTSSIQTQLDNKASSTASPVITLGGDLSGSATFTNLGNATLTATIEPNSVALGTDTTGNYVNDLTAGTGVIVTHTPGEGSSPTIAIGQAVGTSASVTFANITATGTVTLAADPSSALQAVTKQYVDNVAAGINFHESVHAASVTNLGVIYNNGTAGVGATLTADTNRAFTLIDGESVTVGQRVLMKDQTDAKQNGIYTLTTVGSVSAPFVLTRATDADNNPSGEMKSGDFCFVLNGTVNGGYGFINNSSANPIVIGTDNITYTVFNTAQTLTNGSGINLVSNVLSVDTTTIQARVADVSDTEIGYLDGVTSAIQTQLNTKSPSASPTFTGTVTGNPAAGTTSTGTSGFGYMGLPQNGATTGAYGIVAADAGTHIYSSATRTITIPANGTIAMPIGSTIVFIAGSGATVTIAITTDTMLLAGAGTTGSRTLAPFGMATAVKITATSWIISGNGLT